MTNARACRRTLSLILSLTALVPFSGCLMGSTNDRLDTMNETMDRVAVQVEADQKPLQDISAASKTLAEESDALKEQSAAATQELKRAGDLMEKMTAQSQRMADNSDAMTRQGTQLLKEIGVAVDQVTAIAGSADRVAQEIGELARIAGELQKFGTDFATSILKDSHNRPDPGPGTTDDELSKELEVASKKGKN